MSDYIKREDAKQLFMNHLGNHFPQSFKEQIVEKAFEELPLNADVVEVVRCKDCKYWDRDTLKHRLNDFGEWDEAECECLAERDGYNEIDHYVDSDDYCSYGEKKDESDTADND